MDDQKPLLDEPSEAPEPVDPRMREPGNLAEELERLQAKVNEAITEIQRLRDENEALSKRVNEFREDPAAFSENTLLTFEKDPDQLRDHIQQFIDTIDRHLEASASPETEA